MVHELGLRVEIVPCPIVREADGLALSSRNARLTPEGRQVAPAIYRTLTESRTLVDSKTPDEVKAWVTERLNAVGGLRVEYYEIVDSTTLQPIHAWADSPEPRGCIAVYCGEVRLIDNISYK